MSGYHQMIVLVLSVCHFLAPSAEAFIHVASHAHSITQLQLGASSSSLHAHDDDDDNHVVGPVGTELPRRDAMMRLVSGAVAVPALLVTAATATPASARLEAVNRPDLLPKESGLNVIQTEKMLTSGQAKRMDQLLTALERDTGFRVRLLCQNYPNTPGLAIRDYWDLGKEGQKDDKYIVLIADTFGGKSNALNFNVGDGVKFALPNVFWTRLSAKYGSLFYVRENGLDLAITNAMEAIVACLRSEDGYCVDVPANAPSLKSLGLS